jgi:hypothetical protein
MTYLTRSTNERNENMNIQKREKGEKERNLRLGKEEDVFLQLFDVRPIQ